MGRADEPHDRDPSGRFLPDPLLLPVGQQAHMRGVIVLLVEAEAAVVGVEAFALLDMRRASLSPRPDGGQRLEASCPLPLPI
jgi:hypothetical protein